MNPGVVDLSSVGREQELISSLLHTTRYPHPVENVRLIETHISWVILTGHFAYKIKKPIKLEFLDFSSLALRKHFCDEELRLNRRWSPELYLDVVPICGSFAEPMIGGTGPAIEYAVKMRQFPQSAQLDVQLDAGLLDDDDMLDLAAMIAARHDAAEIFAQTNAEVAVGAIVQQPMLQNFADLRAHASPDQLTQLSSWTRNSLRDLWPTLLKRQNEGFIRECHGDLHLRNLVRLSSGIAAFDCVEFSSGLRNIDVISDVSFLMMDLMSRGRRDLAYVFLNRYLECTGDYAGMSVFGLYYVYHALIRAKIAAIRSIERSDASHRQADLEEMAQFCNVASDWIRPQRPCLIIMHGYSGSGKTCLSQQLLSRLPAIRLRSDIERKRRHGLEMTEASGAGVGKGMYAPRARSDIYAVLAMAGETLLQAGQHVIADASFLNRQDRRQFEYLARRFGADFIIVDVGAETEELLHRVRLRKRHASDASEADENVLQYQYDNAQPLSADELQRTVSVATDDEVDAGAVTEKIIGALTPSVHRSRPS